MKKLILLAIFTLVGGVIFAQDGTDIYLFNFSIDQDQFSLSNARNITNSPGYDNQPYFLPDGESLLYSSDDGFGQTDIYRYNVKAASERRLTFTPNSEYSPTITPDGKFFSCIILERDGKQFLWKYPLQGAVPSKVISENPVGYHCWINEHKLGVFIVGEPNQLKVVDLASNNVKNIADYPGTTLMMVPDGKEVLSYVDLSDQTSFKVMNLDTKTGDKVKLIDAVSKKAQFYTWTPSRILIMGDGKRLYKFDPSKDENWVEMANLSDYGIKEFTRITVSPTGNLLAVVVSE